MRVTTGQAKTGDDDADDRQLGVVVKLKVYVAFCRGEYRSADGNKGRIDGQGTGQGYRRG